MTCHDIESWWQSWLDAFGERPEVPASVEQHATSCPECRLRAARYRTLARALGNWGPAPVPSPTLVAAVLDCFEHETTPTMPLAWWPWRRLAAAAALVLAAGLGVRMIWPGRPSTPSSIAAPNRPLGEAFAEVTTATLDLARDTSAPAGRVGREVLASAVNPQSPLELPVVSGAASEVLQSVGDQVNAGVRPLSGTARRAFGFLALPAIGGEPEGHRDDGA